MSENGLGDSGDAGDVGDFEGEAFQMGTEMDLVTSFGKRDDFEEEGLESGMR